MKFVKINVKSRDRQTIRRYWNLNNLKRFFLIGYEQMKGDYDRKERTIVFRQVLIYRCEFEEPKILAYFEYLR